MGILDKIRKHKYQHKYQNKSLQQKLTRSTLVSALALGIVMLLIGLSLYVVTLTGQYITESFCLARSTALIVDRVFDADELSSQVMDVYRGMSDAERQNQRTPEYRQKFAFVEEQESFHRLRTMIKRLQSSSDVDYLYLGVYDPETGNLVYLCDPDEDKDTFYYTGEWEPLKERELNRFLNWNGEGKLFDIGMTDHLGWMCTSGYPVGDEVHDYGVFLLADVTLGGVVRGVWRLVLQYAIALLIVLFLIYRTLNTRMKSILVDPINSISSAAQQYVRDRNAGNTTTDHFDRLGINTGDELEHLSLVMSDMEHSIADYEESITKMVAEREHERTELDLATRIQTSMLPREFPAFPNRKELDIYASMNPARQVGGDFYDFFLIDRDHLGMVVADVSGKGIPAALFMMVSMIIIGNVTVSEQGKDAGEILEIVNNMLYSHNSEDMFVTAWLGILNLSTGHLRAANAGHEYPVIKQPDGDFELFKDKHGFVLGTMTKIKYKEYDMMLEPGSKIFIYSDGLPEAVDENEEMFGTERIVSTLNDNSIKSPEEIIHNMQQVTDLFTGAAPQFDDITMLCLEYKGPDPDEGKSPAPEDTQGEPPEGE